MLYVLNGIFPITIDNLRFSVSNSDKFFCNLIFYVEILSKTDKTVSQLLDGVTRYYASPEIIVKSSDDVKFKVIEKVKEYCKQKGYKVNDIDGVRAEFSNGWALVRASNTGPNITARFEGVTPEDEKAIEEEFMALI